MPFRCPAPEKARVLRQIVLARKAAFAEFDNRATDP
jgi:hypothetical protein